MRSAAATGALGLLLAAAVACGGSPSGVVGEPNPPGGLRGFAVRPATCALTPPRGAERRIPLGSVSALFVCPLRTPGARQQRIVVRPGMPGFVPLLRALAAPDQPRSHDPCPEFADVTQTVLATTADATAYVIALPVDGCGHYQPAALAALTRIRQLTPPSSTPAVP